MGLSIRSTATRKLWHLATAVVALLILSSAYYFQILKTASAQEDTVDTTPPTLNITQPTNNQLFGGPNGQSITVSAVVSDERGLANYRISIDDKPDYSGTKNDSVGDTSPGASVTINTVFNNIPLTNGSHVIYVGVTDKSGNTTEDKRTIYIDNEQPKIAVTPIGTIGGDTLQLMGSVTDDHSVAEYSYQVLDADKNAVAGTEAVTAKGAAESGLLGTWNIKDYPSGAYHVRLIAKDQAGNTAPVSDTSFTIDHTEPLVSVNLMSSATPTASTPVSLQGTVKGHDTVKLLLDNEEVADLAPVVSDDGVWEFVLQDGLVQGRHTLSVVATDQYANVSNMVTSPLSSVELDVGPFAVPVGGTIAPSMTEGLSDPFVVPANLDVPSLLDGANKRTETDVLGAQSSDSPVSQQLQTPAIASTDDGWKVFGMLWYWWLVSIGLLGVAFWQLFALAKRRVAADAF